MPQVPKQGFQEQVSLQGSKVTKQGPWEQVPKQGFHEQVAKQGSQGQVCKQASQEQVPKQGFEEQVPRTGSGSKNKFSRKVPSNRLPARMVSGCSCSGSKNIEQQNTAKFEDLSS